MLSARTVHAFDATATLRHSPRRRPAVWLALASLIVLTVVGMAFAVPAAAQDATPGPFPPPSTGDSVGTPTATDPSTAPAGATSPIQVPLVPAGSDSCVVLLGPAVAPVFDQGAPLPPQQAPAPDAPDAAAETSPEAQTAGVDVVPPAPPLTDVLIQAGGWGPITCAVLIWSPGGVAVAPAPFLPAPHAGLPTECVLVPAPPAEQAPLEPGSPTGSATDDAHPPSTAGPAGTPKP